MGKRVLAVDFDSQANLTTCFGVEDPAAVPVTIGHLMMNRPEDEEVPDPSIPDNPEDWLDEFNTFSIYQVLPKLIELWGMNIRTDVEAKKLYATDREMTTPLFLLRCVQLGISIRDLNLLTIGMVNDMFVESRNDEYKGWRQVATQEDFDRF